MDKNDRQYLKNQACQCLANAACSPARLIAIHTGVISLAAVLLAAANYFLEQQIGATGGLGGIGSRSVLVTVQSMLQLAQSVLLPFWQIGYVYVAMKLARQEATAPADLLEGFRRFGPVLRLHLLKTVISIAVAVLATNIASTIFLVTPFSAPLVNALTPLLSDADAISDPTALQEAITAVGESAMIPLACIFAVVLLLLGVPVFYHYRMASYFLLDSDSPKAFAAMRSSRRLMRYLCLDLFKLDASFWWFYFLEILTVVLCYGDLLLSWMGLSLPFSADAAYYLFFGLYLVSQFGLYLWCKNRVEVTYACAYEFLRSNHDPKPRHKPANQPWVY